MIGLLDGDIVVFRCGFAAERNVWHLQIGEDVTTFDYKRDAEDALDKALPGKFSRVEGEDYRLFPERTLEPLSHALQNVKSLIEGVCHECDLDPQWDLKVMLSDGRNYRHDLAKTRPYKGNRKKEHRPTYEAEIKKYLRENYDCIEAEYEEADDLLGIWQTKEGPENSIIISLDKDLDQIPGLKFNWVNNVHYNITPDEAMYNFHLQLMTGDTTDNIPGLPGIGPGKAAKALHGLETHDEQLAECARMYQIHSGKEDWLEYMCEQGDLLWIRRHPGELWSDFMEIPQVDEGWEQGEFTLEVS